MEVLDKRTQHTIPTSELIRMADVVLKNNYFEFKGQIKQKISSTVIRNKFALPFACLFMDKIETVFLETLDLQLLVWFRCIDHIFYLDTW